MSIAHPPSPGRRARSAASRCSACCSGPSLIGFVGYVPVRTLPTVNEYFTIQRTVDKIAASPFHRGRGARRLRPPEGHRVLDHVDLGQATSRSPRRTTAS
jgi:hypothetical protein